MRIAATCFSEGKYDYIWFSEPMSSTNDDDALRGIGLGIYAVWNAWVGKKEGLVTDGEEITVRRQKLDDKQEVVDRGRARCVCDIRYTRGHVTIDVKTKYEDGQCSIRTMNWVNDVAHRVAEFADYFRKKMGEQSERYVQIRLYGKEV